MLTLETRYLARYYIGNLPIITVHHKDDWLVGCIATYGVFAYTFDYDVASPYGMTLSSLISSHITQLLCVR
jgi:hypothetical protein